jgi:hypothetical protein
VYWAATWQEAEHAEGADLASLDRLLDRLGEEHLGDDALMANVLTRNGDCLSIGLGRTESLLSYLQSSYDPPYWMSRGERSDGGVWFRFSGEATEYPATALIGVERAREAVRHFVRTGCQLWDGVDGQQV